MESQDLPAVLPLVAEPEPAAAGPAPADTPPAPRRPQIAGSAKAAIVVRLLLNEGADVPLEDLPEDLQAQLTQQMGRMGLVDRETLASVVQEFADRLDGVGLSFAGGLAGALSALDGRISAQTASRLRREAGVRKSGDPWMRLREEPIETLSEFALNESTEIAAVLLSKLDTAKAAELLGGLPGPVARRIAYAVSQTGAVTPEAVDRIGLSLASQLDQRPVRAFDDAPGERIGAILNESRPETREDVLTALDETDADFASSVRRSIFVFEHVAARVSPRDVPAIVRAIDQPVLVTALAGATGDDNAASAAFLLGNMSARLADNLREEIADRGSVKPRDGERAMGAVVAAIKGLARAGEIELTTAGEETEAG